MRDFDHSLSGGNGNFKIFTETPGMVKPRESTFHHPAPGKLLPLMGLDFLRNINSKTKLLFHLRDKSTAISGVCTEFLDRRISLICSLRSSYPAFCIMNIGGMDMNRQQTTKHIYYNVPLSAFRFFPPSIPRSSLADTVFTLWESTSA